MSVGRSSTNAFSNHTAFSSADLQAALPELTDPTAPMPPTVMPTFLHEATHHWCFSSTVGTLITVLDSWGRYAMFRAIEANESGERDAIELRGADAITRARVALELLGPLAEGLATFAEFDLAPSLRGPVAPPPLRWAMQYHSTGKGQSATRVRRRMDVASRTALALQEVRCSPERQRAKEALLQGPLGIGGGDGYLAGHLLVHSLWRTTRAKHERFNEPDTFMLWVYDYFYEDPEFMRLLLDDSIAIPDALTLLTRHVGDHIERAFEVTHADLDQFFQRLVQARADLHQRDPDGLQLLPLADPADVEPATRFLAVWDAVIGELPAVLGVEPTWTNSALLLVTLHSIGHGRNLASLGSVPVSVEAVPGTVTARCENGVVVELPALDEEGIASGRGELRILIDTRSGNHVIALSIGLRTVAARSSSPMDKTVLQRTLSGTLGTQAADALFDEASEELGQLHELTRLDGYLDQTRTFLDGLYLPWALAHVPADKLEQVVPKLLADGFYGLFDYDADLIRAMAVLGSTANVERSQEWIESEFTARGLDYPSLIQRLSTVAAETNVFQVRTEPFISCSL